MNLRLLALGGVVVCVVALPLAMASAGSVDDERRPDASSSARSRSLVDTVFPSAAPGTDPKAPSGQPARPSGSPGLLGLGLATAARCGPELTSPDGVEAQTCVLTQGEETWARTYYRNATGRALEAVLSFMGPKGHTVRMRCAVGSDDEPAACETPRERGQGRPAAYTAVAEFAEAGGDGPLLLRSGSNSEADSGS
ncbi:hypothetical protein [Streptomyces sp. A012304]|uniref:hypothetical protein n=1 Tax=Streptomyces sp. A012304 TaxID=375446 RepID=UPI00222E4802|nr:hypothetical protein [Streptomyces sp. A012304]GKQ38594.1 hypothetical protein ALMP_51250 [Streptomyces sp. A012304]